VSSTRFWRRVIAAFFISTLLPCWLLLALFWVGAAIARGILLVGGNQTVLCSFLAVEDGAAGAADSYAVLDFFRANRAIG
jgi:type IV secretory pathway TrbL component